MGRCGRPRSTHAELALAGESGRRSKSVAVPQFLVLHFGFEMRLAWGAKTHRIQLLALWLTAGGAPARGFARSARPWRSSGGASQGHKRLLGDEVASAGSPALQAVRRAGRIFDELKPSIYRTPTLGSSSHETNAPALLRVSVRAVR